MKMIKLEWIEIKGTSDTKTLEACCIKYGFPNALLNSWRNGTTFDQADGHWLSVGTDILSNTDRYLCPFCEEGYIDLADKNSKCNECGYTRKELFEETQCMKKD